MSSANEAEAPSFEARTFAKAAWRVIPLLFIGYMVCFLDRVNVSFAKLQMAGDLQFSDAVYGFGAGIFFIAYFLFEVPSNLILHKVGARLWMARIMITWGIISAGFMFTDDIAWGPISAAFGTTDAEFTFYLLRFLLGVAEAGFFPGAMLYLTFWFPAARRAKMIAFLMASTGVANVIGAPLSGAIMQFMNGMAELRGWEWLFLIEGALTVVVGFVLLAFLDDGPHKAKWLSSIERAVITARLGEEEDVKARTGGSHNLRAAFGDFRLWAFALINLCGAISTYAIIFWLPTIVSEAAAAAPGDYFSIGLISAIPALATIAAQLAWAWNSDRTGERRYHSAIGLIVAIAGMIMLAQADTPFLSLFALTMVTVGGGCWIVAYWVMPPMFLSGAAAAAGIAFINSVSQLGGYFGPDLVGRIRTANNGDADIALYVLAAIAALGALITLITPLTRRPVIEAQST